jgi:hypothetical protein
VKLAARQVKEFFCIEDEVEGEEVIFADAPPPPAE